MKMRLATKTYETFSTVRSTKTATYCHLPMLKIAGALITLLPYPEQTGDGQAQETQPGSLTM